MTQIATFARKAKADIGDIWDFTYRTWSREQANSYVAGLRETIELLADQPQLAALQQDLTPAIRAFPYKSHVILFHEDRHGIHVIRVVHARSNWRTVQAR